MESFGLLVILQLSKPLEIPLTRTDFYELCMLLWSSHNVTQSVLYRCALI